MIQRIGLKLRKSKTITGLKTVCKFFTVLIFLVFTINFVQADDPVFPTAPQPFGFEERSEGPPTPPMPPGPPTQTPIDGGLGFLLAAGGAYALHKIRKQQSE